MQEQQGEWKKNSPGSTYLSTKTDIISRLQTAAAEKVFEIGEEWEEGMGSEEALRV